LAIRLRKPTPLTVLPNWARPFSPRAPLRRYLDERYSSAYITNMPRNPFVLGLSFCLLAGCSASKNEPVMVFAAASTRDALTSILADFQAQTGTTVELNPGPSSTLARQIEQGADADLFLSADQAWADYLSERGLVANSRSLLTNRLVVVTPAASPLDVPSLAALDTPNVSRLALAGSAVPAGRYAREALVKAGCGTASEVTSWKEAMCAPCSLTLLAARWKQGSSTLPTPSTTQRCAPPWKCRRSCTHRSSTRWYSFGGLRSSLRLERSPIFCIHRRRPGVFEPTVSVLPSRGR